jgi:hypothetical protein
MNHFYRMWHDSEKGKSAYVPTDVHWSEVPGRDDEWREQTIANTSEQQFKIEFECEFLGSVNTLIAATKLKNLVYEEPLTRNAGLDIYKEPEKDHNYIMTVDVARGLGNDYSAFLVKGSSYTRFLSLVAAIKVLTEPKNSHSNSILNCCSDVFAIVCLFHSESLPGTCDQCTSVGVYSFLPFSASCQYL